MSFKLQEIVIRVLLIYFGISIGILIRKFIIKKNEKPTKLITQVLLYIIFPFLILSSVINIDLSFGSIIPLTIIFTITIVFAGMISVWLYTKNRNIDGGIKGSAYLIVSFPNSIFIPFPLIIMFFGFEGLITATITAVTILVLQNSIGIGLCILFSNSSEKLSLKLISKKLISFPPTLAVVAGIVIKYLFKPNNIIDALNWIPISPDTLHGLFDTIQWISLIASLIVVGLSFEFTFSFFDQLHLIPFTFFRLVVAPIFGSLVIFFGGLIGIPISQIFVIPIIIQAISGPAIVNIAFSEQFGLNNSATSIYITIITLISVIWMIPVLTLGFILIPP